MSARGVDFRVFRGTLVTWNDLFQQAARFAESLPEGDLISISHSADKAEGVVTVWFRTAEPPAVTPTEPRPPVDY